MKKASQAKKPVPKKPAKPGKPAKSSKSRGRSNAACHGALRPNAVSSRKPEEAGVGRAAMSSSRDDATVTHRPLSASFR